MGCLSARFLSDFRSPMIPLPIEALGRGLIRQAFPPNAAFRSQSHIGEDRVLRQRGDRVRIGAGRSAGRDAEKPASGLIARSSPLSSGRIQAMSSPTVQIFQSSNPSGGISMARLVLPQALGNAAAIYVFSPSGFSTPRINMCSAIQPSSRAMLEAIRRAKHFLPSRAFPP